MTPVVILYSYTCIAIAYLLLHLCLLTSSAHARDVSRSKEFKLLYKKLKDYHIAQIKLSALWPYMIVRDTLRLIKHND